MLSSSLSHIIFQSLLLGVFLSIFLYHVVMYVINRSRAFLYYLLYAFSLICCLYFHPSNVLFSLLQPELFASEAVWQYIQLFAGAGIVIFYILFCISLIDYETWKPHLLKWLRILVVLFIVDLVLALVSVTAWGFDYSPYGTLLQGFISVIRTLFFWAAVGFLLFTVINYLLADDRLTQYLGLSSLFLLIGGAIFALSDYRFNPFAPAVNNYHFFQVTVILQLMTFGFLLSYRELKMKKEKVELEAVDAAKSRFFANISHEFRTPLTLILSPVSDLLNKRPSGPNRMRLELIQNNARRLLQLVNQILDLARLEANQIKVNLQPVELAARSRQWIAAFESIAADKKIDLAFNSSPDEIWMSFDPDHLEKMITNLLSNAVKYTPEGGEIRLSVELDVSDDQVAIKVEDSGAGIPQKLIPHIFDRYYQSDNTNFTTDQPGTGIGLALTKELVELHNGYIEVQSSPGVGTTFILAFPYVPVQPVEDTPGFSSLGKVTGKLKISDDDALREALSFAQNMPLILLIEDNRAMAGYLQDILNDSFQVVIAEDGAAGIRLAKEKVPDIIITDVMMPKKDGFEVTEELKSFEATSHIPIIILTGKASRDSKLHGLKKDADEYLTKPFNAVELKIRIRNLLRNRKRLQTYFGKNLLFKSSPEKVHSQESVFLQKIFAVIDRNLGDENFTVESLAQALSLDRSQLYRKLQALVDKSPSELIRVYRLHRAKELLEGDAGSVSEIAYRVGFKDAAYFSRCFKEVFGYPPSQVKMPD